MVTSVNIDKKLYDLIAPERSEEVTEGFEAIYRRFQSQGSEGAKSFLQSLSPTELERLQQFHSLAENIDVTSLDAEGALNLLQKGFEKKDLDGDGLYNVGAATTMGMVPRDASPEFKQALFDGLKALEQKEGKGALFKTMMTLSFQFNKGAMLQKVADEAGMDLTAQGFDFTFAGMKSYMDGINDPKRPGYMDPELKNDLNSFFEGFKKSYETSGVALEQESKTQEDTLSAAQKAMLQKLLDKGALQFYTDLNMEKIEKLIEEKRKELEAKYGFDQQTDPKKLAQITAQIEQELEAFRKELMEKLAKKSESDGKVTAYGLKDLLALELTGSRQESANSPFQRSAR